MSVFGPMRRALDPRRLTRPQRTLLATALAALTSAWALAIMPPRGPCPLACPGLLFGLAFAGVHFRGWVRVVLFTLASGLIYHAALVLTLDHPLTPRPEFVAGAVAAAALGLLAPGLAGRRPRLGALLGLALAGGLLGLVFSALFFAALVHRGLGLVFLAFAVWQLPVGWLLSRSLRPPPGA